MLNEPIRLTLITLSKSASGIGPSRPITRLATPMPAQLTSTRAGPWVLDALAMAASAEAASETSQTIATPFISAATLSASLALRSHTATLAPCAASRRARSEEHTSELQSQFHLVCRLLLEKKKKKKKRNYIKKLKKKKKKKKNKIVKK